MPIDEGTINMPSGPVSISTASTMANRLFKAMNENIVISLDMWTHLTDDFDFTVKDFAMLLLYFYSNVATEEEKKEFKLERVKRYCQ